MTKRPAPRRSNLAGASPVAPTTSSETPTPTEAAPAPAAAVPAAPAAVPRATTRTTTAGSKYRHKVSFYQEPEDTDRVRGAILHTMISEGSRTLSQFIHQAVMAEVERLEAKYNAGQPFPPVGARELPQGRPMGE